ncbi:hypothetical protein GobsT_06110 [Gemmata obscuriglobus]|uniref:Uma2 family endonuclease n=1 Tax=Gemmata obscuriglobus TaxID=114 RepID=A0A2Z3H555_9BACT|nr:Uma2 family endonuclease [Gemmata obscuriglobus]AWM40838.1 Uma2 family endonuclease [Gemmata obscuriglobus]QEG25876.1 hypothetical protein GobsT_06110 [Gemmata obscuriglobus]VTR99906.1 Uncharacterized protein OS=Candidatus Entotheonella sp. TSY1 GN=ETSY1_25475 PE=4 SV=1: Uma2 [Gemmata obscuriglobus UQM 2246]
MTHNAVSAVLEPDDLLAMPGGDRYELIDGRLKGKETGAESDKVALRIGGLLDQFCVRTKSGIAFGSQTGFRCFPKQPKLARKPDAAVIVAGRLPDDKWPKGDIALVPDLVVEAVSTHDTYEEVAVKVTEFKSVGVKLIWVISPETRTVLVRRADGTCVELDETGTLSGENVLPGFACPVADLFI